MWLTAASEKPVLRDLGEPVDASAVAVVRACFGLIIAWQAVQYASPEWIATRLVEPPFHFTYFGFGWVKPLGLEGMRIVYWTMGVAAVAVALGLFYRAAAVILCLTFGYHFLLEAALYLNHYYAAWLFTLLLAFIPAHRAWSLDRLIKGPATDVVSALSLYVLRCQVGVIYAFGGIAKLDPEWLSGAPVRLWAKGLTHVPIMRMLVEREWEVAVFTYGGLAFDLLIVPALLWRRTRVPAFCASVVFHFMNSQLFHIGIFPWMMIALTTLFFPADWPRRCLRVIGVQTTARGADTNWRWPSLAMQRAALGYCVVQCLIPLRHFAYPGPVNWTDEGQMFSWQMMLKVKRGTVSYSVETVSGHHEVEAARYLTARQQGELPTRPDMILQFAHFLRHHYTLRGETVVAVRATALASLNGRAMQPLVDSQVNLAAVDRSLLPARWIVRERSPLAPASPAIPLTMR